MHAESGRSLIKRVKEIEQPEFGVTSDIVEPIMHADLGDRLIYS